MIILRKWAALLLAVLLVLPLAACSFGGGNDVSSVPVQPSSVAQSASQADSAPPEPEPQGLEPLPLATDTNALTGGPRPEGMAEGQRPVAVIVSNNQRSLPQRGLAAADVLVETLTEGGVTRLMAMYADYRSVPQVGPVRSTRDQFVQMALPSAAIQVHIGTSVYARNLLTLMGEKDVDGMYLGRTAFYFDTARNLPKPGGKLNEYCWFTDAGLIWSAMEYSDVITTGEVRSLFKFTGQPAAAGEEAAVINLAYSDQAWCGFTYNAETGLYDKSIFGNPHTDEDGSPLSYRNVLILGCPITVKPDALCAEFDFRGSAGWYFTAGGVTELYWQKGGPQDPLRLFTPEGEEVEVQTGKTYIGIVNEDKPDSLSWGPPAPPTE